MAIDNAMYELFERIVDVCGWPLGADREWLGHGPMTSVVWGRCGPLISPFLIGFVTILVVAFLCFLGLMRGSRDG
jgi:hypothetical protein